MDLSTAHSCALRHILTFPSPCTVVFICLLFPLPLAHSPLLSSVFTLPNQRVRSALTDPKYNYFSGLAAAVPAVLVELQEEVLSSFSLNNR